MSATTVAIEPIPPGTEPEMIELAVGDGAALRAASTLRGNEGVRFVSTYLPRGDRRAELAPSPVMVVAVGDGRSHDRVTALMALRRTGVLNVAIVVVEPSTTGAELTRLAHHYDAVLPIHVGRDADVEAPFASAARVMTAFATADCISVPVDEVYPFFVGAHILAWGTGSGANIEAAAATALDVARLGAGKHVGRVLLHIETTAQDLATDLRLAMDAVGRIVEVDDVQLSASVSTGLRGGQKGVSLLASTSRARRR